MILVGVGGSVPQYNDYHKHPRLGDVVISVPSKKGGPVYVHCDHVDQADKGGKFNYSTKEWRCSDERLEKAVNQLRNITEYESNYRHSWARHIEHALDNLQAGESTFYRPDPKTDKLYAPLDGRIVQVEHPKPSHGGHERPEQAIQSRLRYGPIGAGRFVARSDTLRMDFSRMYGLMAFDGDFNAVLESVEGNRKDSFLIIKGIADYGDGSQNKEWQAYASVAAAACLKALLIVLPSGRSSGYYR